MLAQMGPEVGIRPGAACHPDQAEALARQALLGQGGEGGNELASRKVATGTKDHDLEPDLKLTPFGLHRPDTAETWLSFTTGSATADFMVDRLSELWPTLKKTVILHIPSS